jgi:hypothetical protein
MSRLNIVQKKVLGMHGRGTLRNRHSNKRRALLATVWLVFDDQIAED